MGDSGIGPGCGCCMKGFHTGLRAVQVDGLSIPKLHHPVIFWIWAHPGAENCHKTCRSRHRNRCVSGLTRTHSNYSRMQFLLKQVQHEIERPTKLQKDFWIQLDSNSNMIQLFKSKQPWPSNFEWDNLDISHLSIKPLRVLIRLWWSPPYLASGTSRPQRKLTNTKEFAPSKHILSMIHFIWMHATTGRSCYILLSSFAHKPWDVVLFAFSCDQLPMARKVKKLVFQKVSARTRALQNAWQVFDETKQSSSKRIQIEMISMQIMISMNDNECIFQKNLYCIISLAVMVVNARSRLATK